MRIALLLSTALVTTRPDHPDRERRVQQYVDGFQQIGEVVGRYPCFDVFSMDNTVEDPQQTDLRAMAALERIPTLRGKYHFWDNEIGKLNKGSGVVTQWNQALPEISGQYEYVVHYEPRQHLVDFSFFERMATQPDNYFCMYRDKVRLYGIPVTLPRFWTGMFSMRSQALLAYVRARDRRVLPRAGASPRWPTLWRFYRHFRWQLRSRLLPDWAADLEESIESDFPRYVRRHNVPIVRVAVLGARWHEELGDRWLDMVDCDFLDGEVVT